MAEHSSGGHILNGCEKVCYRGRIAPSPTGFLHAGHARTFWIAQERARANSGVLVFRNEDLDPARSRPEFVEAMIEDLHWFGVEWQEGPDVGGPFAPYTQSQRIAFYREAFDRLRAANVVYPCQCTRKEVLSALQAPQAGDDEPIYPGTCRPGSGKETSLTTVSGRITWRFQVADGQEVAFEDGCCGPQAFVAGKDFGDFVVWRHDNLPSYQLAVVVDDAAMRMTEVVRGEDLLRSTARQLLLYRALQWTPPKFYHCPLVKDSSGMRLAKRHDALSLRTLREDGESAATLRRRLFA